MQDIASSKSGHNPICIYKGAGRKDRLGFGFKAHAINHDRIDPHIAIRSGGGIQKVIGKLNSNVVRRHICCGSKCTSLKLTIVGPRSQLAETCDGLSANFKLDNFLVGRSSSNNFYC